MATIADYFEQAQFSLAAYALDLQQGMFGMRQDYIDALKFAGGPISNSVCEAVEHR